MSEKNRKDERGFASMDQTKQREIASKGGKAAHAKGTAHQFTSEEAKAAGRKGGESVSRDRKHMSEIGREGGRSSRIRDNGESDNELSASSLAGDSGSSDNFRV